MKTILYLVLGFGLGLMLLIIGVNEVSKDTPTCGGRAMSQGDRCVSSKGGRRDFDAQLRSDHRGGYVMIGIGGLMALGSVAVGGAALVTPTKQSGATPAVGNLTPQTGFPPQQYPGQPHSGQHFSGQHFSGQPLFGQPLPQQPAQPFTPPPTPPGPNSPRTTSQ